jgi:ElaB/YqjD/DUF883 family membrane-anchored ribosome-binding protein
MAYSAPHTSDARRGASSDTANDLAGKAAELADKAGRHLDSAATSAESTVRQVAESGREASQRVNEVAGNLKSAVDKSLKEQPLTTLAMAAGAGFVIGALWKS